MNHRGILALGLAGLLWGCSDDPVSAPPPTEAPPYQILLERSPGTGPRGLVLIDPETGAETPFGPVGLNALQVMPSPDGSRLAFLAATDEGLHLWTMAREGGVPVDLFDGVAADINGASWAPGGSRLAYSETSDGSAFDIWTMQANGTGRVNLTPDPLPGVWIDVWPAWSPDGARIAFSSNRNGFSQVWVMGADGSSPSVLAGGVPGDYPSWDAAGERIGFVTWTGTRFAIVVARLDGSAPQTYPQTGSVATPVWTPEGFILFIGNPTGTNYELMALDPATGVTVNLSNSAAHESWVTILPREDQTALRASNRE